MSWNTGEFPEEEKSNMPVFTEREWSDPGNRSKKGNITNASKHETVGNMLCGADTDSFDEMRSFLVKAAMFIPYWDLE